MKKRYKELFQKELKLRCYGDSRTGTSRFGGTTSAIVALKHTTHLLQLRNADCT